MCELTAPHDRGAGGGARGSTSSASGDGAHGSTSSASGGGARGTSKRKSTESTGSGASAPTTPTEARPSPSHDTHEQLTTIGEDGKPRYVCRHCGRSFHHIGNCRSHELKHEDVEQAEKPTPVPTGDPLHPHGCPKCGAFFHQPVIHSLFHSLLHRFSLSFAHGVFYSLLSSVLCSLFLHRL